MTMFDRETMLPLSLGLVVAVLSHLAAAAAVVQWSDETIERATQLPEAERSRRSRERARRADLVAEAIAVSEPRIAGQPTTITWRITNRGKQPAEPFTYELQLDGDRLATGQTEQPLAPGEQVERSLKHVVERAGTHRLTLIADEAAEVADADRGNNQLSRAYFWQPAAADRPEGVDVAVAELRIGEPRIVGAPVTISGRLVNLGRSDAGVFNVTLLVDGEAVEERTVDALRSGESDRFVTRIYVDEPGEHAVTLAATGGGLRNDIDEQNNALTQRATWQNAEDMERPTVGQREPSPVKLNWISYEDYEDLVARRAEFEQAALQPHADPVDNAPTPQDPTPPAPPEARQAQTPPPAPQVDPQPRPSEQVVEPDPSPESPSQPTVPERISEQESTAPTLELEREAAAATAEAEAGLPDPPDAAERDATQAEPVTDLTEAEDPVAATPEQATPSQEVAIATLDLPEADIDDPDLLLPETSEREAEDVVDRRAPVAEVDEEADPTDRSLQLRVDELLERREVTLPLEPDAAAEPGSPQQEATEDEATDRTTQTADRPVDPSRPLADGARPEEPREQQPVSPTQAEQPPSQPSEEADPTSAPRDERESPPVSRLSDLRVQPGRVIARQGIEIRTVEPRFSDIAKRTSLPRDPEVLITFSDEGEVLYARLVRSSGYANVDGPVLASLYRWTARGELLADVDDSFTLRVRILFGVVQEDDDEDEDEDAEE